MILDIIIVICVIAATVGMVFEWAGAHPGGEVDKFLSEQYTKWLQWKDRRKW